MFNSSKVLIKFENLFTGQRIHFDEWNSGQFNFPSSFLLFFFQFFETQDLKVWKFSIILSISSFLNRSQCSNQV